METKFKLKEKCYIKEVYFFIEKKVKRIDISLKGIRYDLGLEYLVKEKNIYKYLDKFDEINKKNYQIEKRYRKQKIYLRLEKEGKIEDIEKEYNRRLRKIKKQERAEYILFKPKNKEER